MTVVTGKPGAAYICPVHGRFIPTDLPRYDHDQPEAKCMAWVTATAYCGEYAPLAPTEGVFAIEPDPPDLADRQAERVVAHQRRERGESSPAWSSLSIVAEVAGRYAALVGAGLRLELLPTGPSAVLRFEDIKGRHLEIDLVDGGNASAYRGLVEVEILSFRNSGPR